LCEAPRTCVICAWNWNLPLVLSHAGSAGCFSRGDGSASSNRRTRQNSHKKKERPVLKILLPAAVLAILAAPVAATPISSGGLAAQAPDNIHEVAQGGPHRPHFRPHVRKPPRGWHRYHQRPWDWHRRGCMQVGPLWFCP
jgi:hypothetical protein